MVDGPIQLVINADRFRDQRVPPFGGGQRKDFFQGNDAGFVEHRTRLSEAIILARSTLAGRPYINILVKMRADAIAKSHRPFGKLFRPSAASHVGTEGYGELIFSVASSKLQPLLQDVLSAEEVVAWVTDSRGAPRYSPSTARSEVSAIESISEWVPSQQRGFSLDDAEQWVNSGQGAGLIVDLLDAPGRSETLAPYLRSLPQLEEAVIDQDISVSFSVPPGLAKRRLEADQPVTLIAHRVEGAGRASSVRQ